MKIDQHTLKGIAHLARLEPAKSEALNLQKDLELILTWMEKLNELDTTNVEPLRHMSHEVNILREDEATYPISATKALRNAPNADGTFFLVPKVIGD